MLQILKTLLEKDYSEIFTETLKKLQFQSATWSDYKPHNTVEFLVCVVPSLTMFWFLDALPRHSNIILNRGFYEVLPDVYICLL